MTGHGANSFDRDVLVLFIGHRAKFVCIWCFTVFSNWLIHKIFSCHTIFETSHSKCKTTHQISKTISYFSAFDSVVNCTNTFFKTLLYLKHKNLTGSDLLSLSKHNQSKCYIYSPGHTHTPHMCKH